MGQRITILTSLLLSFCTGTTIAQDFLDSSEPKNTISISVLPTLDRTISFIYARQLKNGHEITFNPRIRIAKSTPASNKKDLFLFEDPQWYYDQYVLRTGMIVHFNNTFAWEPQLQLGFARFKNQLVVTEDVEGDAYDEAVWMDRRYYSTGIINGLSVREDTKWIRLKLSLGFGIHLRYYDQTDYALQRYRGLTTYPEPIESHYYKTRGSFHLALEIGWRY